MGDSRLFEMVYLLLEQEAVPASEFARRFEISVRTVYRDVDRLLAAGIPVVITRGRKGGLSLMNGFRLDRTALTREERQQILSALRAIQETVPGETSGVLRKLSAFFGGEIPDWIEVDFGTWSLRPQEQNRFASLKEAILTRHVVSFLYTGTRGEPARRTAEPLRLVFRSRAWYLLAWCRQRQAERFFHLTRMGDLTVLEDIFPPRIPESRPKCSVSPERISVCLHFDPQVGSRVLDDFGDCIREPDGSLTVRGPILRIPWLVSLLLGYGSACRVEEPAWLRQAVLEELHRTLACYKYKKE